MATKNDITGDSIQTRGVSENYRNNYDLIWGKKKKETIPMPGTTGGATMTFKEDNESSDSNTDNRE